MRVRFHLPNFVQFGKLNLLFDIMLKQSPVPMALPTVLATASRTRTRGSSTDRIVTISR